MKIPKVIDELETKIINTLKLSRFKNQVVGKGYVTGLKAVTYLLSIPKPTIFMSKGASIRLCESVAQFGLKKLLIVTYRFTIPPLGGAEVYMYELIKGLDKLDNFDITVAFLDSYDIKNQYHFSIDATNNYEELEDVFQNITFEKFKFDELTDIQKYDNSKLLMQNWTNEFLLSARKHIDKYNDESLYSLLHLINQYPYQEQQYEYDALVVYNPIIFFL